MQANVFALFLAEAKATVGYPKHIREEEKRSECTEVCGQTLMHEDKRGSRMTCVGVLEGV